MRQSTHVRVQQASPSRALRARRRASTFVAVAIVSVTALVALPVGASASTSATSIRTGVVVIKTTLGYADGAAAGTGMVLTSSGEILTNNHVVRGATSIKVVIPATGRTYTARVVGYDVTDDVAVIQAVGASNLKMVTTATSSTLSIGSAVTAVGNAGGTGRLISATGTITALGRSVTVGDDQGGSVRLTGMVGTNADVQPGDSGGPLLNGAGEVIGMDTAGSTGYSLRSSRATQAYAIAILRALSVVKKVESGASTTRVHIGETAFLGVQIASERGPGESSTGVVVAGIVPGGPAASAGLGQGDVITAIDGHTISTPSSIRALIVKKQPGDSLTVVYSDQAGERQTATITLVAGPAQ